MYKRKVAIAKYNRKHEAGKPTPASVKTKVFRKDIKPVQVTGLREFYVFLGSGKMIDAAKALDGAVNNPSAFVGKISDAIRTDLLGSNKVPVHDFMMYVYEALDILRNDCGDSVIAALSNVGFTKDMFDPNVRTSTNSPREWIS